MSVEFSEFKGHKTIVLTDDNNTRAMPFSFGKNKAKLIVENIEAIKDFAEEE
jgi:hypothetical protein